MGNLKWGMFDDLPQVTRVIDGEEKIYAQIGNRLYSRHALERMAPKTPEVLAKLEKRAVDIASNKGLKSGTKEFNNFVKKYVDPRNIPPMVVEDAVQKAPKVAGNRVGTFVHETSDIKVIVNTFGDVITVIPK